MGLVISRQAVEADGGRLRARDMLEKGCVFIVDLPRALGEPASEWFAR
jgi:signal transduction histidine kinase